MMLLLQSMEMLRFEIVEIVKKEWKTRMWANANAQRDGRPAEYRWCPLFNAAKFHWRPLLVPCSNGAKTRNPLKLAGLPQTNETISAISKRSSPYCEDVWDIAV